MCTLVETTVDLLESEYEITLNSTSTRSQSATTIAEFQESDAILDLLLSNISHFSDAVVQLLVSSSVFNPVSFPV